MNNQISIEVEKHKSEINKWYQFYVGLDIGADFHVAACISFEKFRVKASAALHPRLPATAP
ncbi:hypothetical protein [Paenibacillus thalictri]|uniref:IS110 family transposase n=1 Tax=Paenibacillus thalictri TaxID=2527873 RepID=A0A4Q9DRF8_9BACL|nr:hypothetical protein [Paenibacillus thalictri]TBL78465.1 hypothetical protein EYB31_13225 [Paenibacillus thalictri]